MNGTFKYQLSMKFENWKRESIINAVNEEDAKYKYYQQLKSDFIEMPFEGFKKFINCKYKGIADIRSMFGDEKAFRKMCKRRKILFAHLGMRVQVVGKMGYIVGSYKENLYVVFDGTPKRFNVNPCWEIAYYDQNGNIIKDFRKGTYATVN
ncbi:hypothetical protein ACIGHG_23645 [Bacillus sp. NPDC077411]|uniref:hypothetical protein n=1 Tax=Bacillus sp. NPDC077411 TaxID=3363947 RepID=UPI0037C74A85